MPQMTKPTTKLPDVPHDVRRALASRYSPAIRWYAFYIMWAMVFLVAFFQFMIMLASVITNGLRLVNESSIFMTSLQILWCLIFAELITKTKSSAHWTIMLSLEIWTFAWSIPIMRFVVDQYDHCFNLSDSVRDALEKCDAFPTRQCILDGITSGSVARIGCLPIQLQGNTMASLFLAIYILEFLCLIIMFGCSVVLKREADWSTVKKHQTYLAATGGEVAHKERTQALKDISDRQDGIVHTKSS